PPWAVSLPAQVAGLAALKDEDYLVHLRVLVEKERPRLQAALEDMGLRVIPGAANFLLFFTRDRNLGDKLRARGILIRSCADFSGLAPGWFRIAVRTPEENDALLRAMKEVLASG
ncbi:MAG: aminotransferase class I/II-fold pyridoxal phosphate-dependent enzyme, partial [Oscillospiraceae bacterium]|nr:aminotransferase class I/II-fold pyridoxal phosphate-dependent enzyme [Oscillospiraceae bacterium]